MTRRVRIGGVAIDALSFGQTLDRIGDLVDGRAGGSVFTANVDHVLKAEQNDAFRAAYGETPMRYLSRRRIERAQDLLRSANLTVTEICMLVGFTSLAETWPPMKLRAILTLSLKHNSEPTRQEAIS